MERFNICKFIWDFYFKIKNSSIFDITHMEHVNVVGKKLSMIINLGIFGIQNWPMWQNSFKNSHLQSHHWCSSPYGFKLMEIMNTPKKLFIAHISFYLQTHTHIKKSFTLSFRISVVTTCDRMQHSVFTMSTISNSLSCSLGRNRDMQSLPKASPYMVPDNTNSEISARLAPKTP